VIGIDVRNVRPVETDRIQPESDIVERAADFRLDRNPRRVIERFQMPSALPEQNCRD
jgi:hypothetical protein